MSNVQSPGGKTPSLEETEILRKSRKRTLDNRSNCGIAGRQGKKLKNFSRYLARQEEFDDDQMEWARKLVNGIWDGIERKQPYQYVLKPRVVIERPAEWMSSQYLRGTRRAKDHMTVTAWTSSDKP